MWPSIPRSSSRSFMAVPRIILTLSPNVSNLLLHQSMMAITKRLKWTCFRMNENVPMELVLDASLTLFAERKPDRLQKSNHYQEQLSLNTCTYTSARKMPLRAMTYGCNYSHAWFLTFSEPKVPAYLYPFSPSMTIYGLYYISRACFYSTDSVHYICLCQLGWIIEIIHHFINCAHLPSSPMVCRIYWSLAWVSLTEIENESRSEDNVKHESVIRIRFFECRRSKLL